MEQKTEIRKFTPSPLQRAIFDQIAYTDTNIVVKSTAGAGKTTTIVQGTKYIPYGKSCAFIAFTNAIVEELKGRLPESIHCSTLHKLGFAAIRATIKNCIVQEKDNKAISFLMPYFDKIQDVKKKWSHIMVCLPVFKMIRATMTPLNVEAIREMCSLYGYLPNEEEVLACMRALRDMDEYNQNTRSNLKIDFQDMIEMCVKYSNIHRMPQYDYVFIDEAQDLSELDLRFLLRVVRPHGGRIIAVGDPEQAIYGFKGSDINSFNKLCAMPNTVVLPLDVTYRVPKSGVEHARKVYQTIKAHEGAIEGKVHTKVTSLKNVREGDLVISRNVKPLISVYFRLIGQGRHARIVGRDIEKGLLDYLDRYDQMSVEELREELTKDMDKLVTKLKEKGVTNFDNNAHYTTLSERQEVIMLLSNGCSTVVEVQQKIMEVFFDDQMEAIKLMTIHKSKGLEADRVWMIESFEGKMLIPSTYAVTSGQLLQERNLEFVARTRHKQELFRVKFDPNHQSI